MHWLQSLDISLFRIVNEKLANPVFDWLMPFASGNALFYPALLLLAALLIRVGGRRGLMCVLMLALIVPLGDGLVCNTIKKGVGRYRPFDALPDVRRPDEKDGYGRTQSRSDAPGKPSESMPRQRTGSASMPSSHAANWFAGAMVGYVFYRRSARYVVPVASLVAFSRVYNGVHFPSDVLAGAILGAGYAAAGVWSLELLWRRAGAKWWPIWWREMPSLISPDMGSPNSEVSAQESAETLDQHWLRLGYVIIAVLLLARIWYLGSGTLDLTGDEAYQWLWSKHLALSYYSKPPMIAYLQLIGTSIWGDTELGVRFFSPVITAVMSFVLLRFIGREVNARAGVFMVLIATATPLLAAGGVLMTVDPPSALFWAAAMISGWKAIQPEGKTSAWLWTGLWMGLGFLSKYTELLQLVSWAVFFILWPPARKHLRRPGPYLALLVNALCTIPVLIWNIQHQWAGASHLAGNAHLDEPWRPEMKEHMMHLLEFLGGEAVLLNLVFSVGTVWAAVAFWRRRRHDPRLIYFFSMGAPLFLIYLFFTLHSRVNLNWIAPSVVPLFCLMVTYWDAQWRLGAARLKLPLILGVGCGLPLILLAHNTELIGKFTGLSLPPSFDPLHRAHGWTEVARFTDEARQELLAEGKPVFIIADDYRLAGEISFYLPEARAADQKNPLVYCRSTEAPETQFYFWPGYSARKGENAVFVRDLERADPQILPPPERLATEFESLTNMPSRDVFDKGKLLWPLQFTACRGLK